MYGNEYDQDFLFGDIPIVRSTRQPCPICGHPTGDCTGDSPPPGHIVGQTDRTKDEDMVLVEHDVIEEKYITPFTKTKILLAAKGSYITRKKAEELGLT